MGGADLKGMGPALHAGKESFDSQLSGSSSVTEVSSAGIGTLLPPAQPCLVGLVITLHPHCWIAHRCNLPGLLHTISKTLRLPVWAIGMQRIQVCNQPSALVGNLCPCWLSVMATLSLSLPTFPSMLLWHESITCWQYRLPRLA